MTLIDTHTHVVSDDFDRYPLNPAGLPGGWFRDAPRTAEQLIESMDEAGVERSVLVQGVGAYSFDNSYVADARLAHPERFWSACCVDVAARNATDRLDYWLGERGMDGVRVFAVAAGGASWIDDESAWPMEVFERAQALGAPVIVTVVASQLAPLGRLLARFPELVVSLDHCGFAPLLGPPWSEALELFDLAEHPGVHLKLTTNVIDAMLRSGCVPARGVEELVSRFGAGRVMWGSDFCQTHDRSYSELVRLGQESFATLDAVERRACLGGTALRLWSGA
ncbi:MAG: amidohydrolase family protein [Myxococcota bacterium]|nr:amidohydrolase family protein [Myxococcota bacterium]